MPRRHLSRLGSGENGPCLTHLLTSNPPFATEFRQQPELCEQFSLLRPNGLGCLLQRWPPRFPARRRTAPPPRQGSRFLPRSPVAVLWGLRLVVLLTCCVHSVHCCLGAFGGRASVDTNTFAVALSITVYKSQCVGFPGPMNAGYQHDHYPINCTGNLD